MIFIEIRNRTSRIDFRLFRIPGTSSRRLRAMLRDHHGDRSQASLSLSLSLTRTQISPTFFPPCIRVRLYLPPSASPLPPIAISTRGSVPTRDVSTHRCPRVPPLLPARPESHHLPSRPCSWHSSALAGFPVGSPRARSPPLAHLKTRRWPVGEGSGRDAREPGRWRPVDDGSSLVAVPVRGGSCSMTIRGRQ